MDASAAAPRTIRRSDYRPPAYLIDRVALDFDLQEGESTVASRFDFRRNPDGDGGPLELDGEAEAVTLVSIALDGRELGPGDYSLDAARLVLADPPAAGTLHIVTRIRPEENTALSGLYRSGAMYCSQCEAEGFRRITYWPDRPDVMSRFTVRIAADAARFPVLLSNGNPGEAGVLEGGRHFAIWDDPFLKPSYLFALVAGDLARVDDSFTTASGRTVDLRIYVEHGNEDKCAHAMDSLKKSMRWDEEVFGLEYDLDIFMIVAVSDFNMGAMENKGLNIFNTSAVLASPQTATDRDFANIESIVAHEYFHNWTGNRVTCRDWFQLSLKEGLTVFRDQEFSSDLNSRAVQRIADVEQLRAMQFPEDAGPTAHPIRPDSYIEINNFYTPTVYEKGAEVIRAMHRLLGPQGFRQGMDLYFQRHDGQAVTCDDFVAAMQDATGIDLTRFRRWYAQAGTPTLTAAWSHDATARTLTLDLRQHTAPTPGQPDKQPLVLPIVMGLLGADGAAMPLRLEGERAPAGTERVLVLEEEAARFTFADVDSPALPALLRGFSAPVRLDAPYTEADLAFLMRHDSDSFTRWESGRMLAAKLLLGAVAAETAPNAAPLLEAFAALLDEAEADPAFAAQALSLPDENDLAQQVQPVPVDALHVAHRSLRRDIGRALEDRWLALYRRLSVAQPYSTDAHAMGRRALRALALDYLCAAQDAHRALAEAQYTAADNMTDSLAALRRIADGQDATRDRLLADFLQRWRHEDLVVNKWFSLQALADRPTTVEDVRALLDHEAFRLANPNRVRALIGGFSRLNAVHFHRIDGAGYRLLEDTVRQLDPLNPQVAARMAGGFARWRRYDTARQALMQDSLRRILQQPGLSPDSFEIVSKSLG